MAEDKKIKLTSFLESFLKFKKDPTPEVEDEVAKIVDQFVIREYIPLAEKQVYIASILSCIPDDANDALVAENWITMGKVIYGILSYVVNLENDLDRASLVPAVIDVLYESGVVDKILKYSQKDYSRMEQMIQEALNFSNIFRIVQTAALFDKDQLDTFIGAIYDFKKDLTPELLEGLTTIAVSNSPEYKALRETIMGEALESSFKGEMASIHPVKEPKDSPSAEAPKAEDSEGGEDKGEA